MSRRAPRIAWLAVAVAVWIGCGHYGPPRRPGAGAATPVAKVESAGVISPADSERDGKALPGADPNWTTR